METIEEIIQRMTSPQKKNNKKVIRLIDEKDLLSIIENLPEKYLVKGFSNYEAYLPSLQRKKDICIKFTKGEIKEKILLFSGTNGNGKSHLIISIAKNLPAIDKKLLRRFEIDPTTKVREDYYYIQKCPQRSIYFTGESFFSTLNEIAYEKNNKDNYMDILCKKYDLIIIDDIQEIDLNNTKIVNLFNIVDKIYNQTKCRLILSMNFTLDTLEQYHKSINSRLKEDGIVLIFNEPDYRSKKND